MDTIANCRDWQECQLLKSKLESAGISVFVPVEMSNLDGLILHFGGFRVQVAEEDAAAAGAVLETQKPSDSVAGARAVEDGGEQGVFCGGCGISLDQPANLPEEERTPCPSCGSMSRHFVATCSDELTLSEGISLELTPGAQTRDWRQRWTEIQEHLKRLLAPHFESMSAVSIQNANHELHSFFVQAYHLKDSLIQDAGATGVTAAAIEDAVTADPHLALLADLANLDKHGRLTKPPRSGDVLTWQVSGASDANAGWLLKLKIRHKGQTHDGLTFADEAVSAWRRHLQTWGLNS
jgi:hypothetical protein